jgi:hypothetical protein
LRGTFLLDSRDSRAVDPVGLADEQAFAEYLPSIDVPALEADPASFPFEAGAFIIFSCTGVLERVLRIFYPRAPPDDENCTYEAHEHARKTELA